MKTFAASAKAPLFKFTPRLLEGASQPLRACPSQSGCPSCVGPVGEVGERGKETAGFKTDSLFDSHLRRLLR